MLKTHNKNDLVNVQEVINAVTLVLRKTMGNRSIYSGKSGLAAISQMRLKEDVRALSMRQRYELENLGYNIEKEKHRSPVNKLCDRFCMDEAQSF